jgi:hypothetical protein
VARPVLQYFSFSLHVISVADPGCLSRIPDPNCLHPGSASKNLSILTQKWFLSSRKYDPGCSFRIPDQDADFLPIPDPGVKEAPDPGSESAKLHVISHSSVCAYFRTICSTSGIGPCTGTPKRVLVVVSEFSLICFP